MCIQFFALFSFFPSHNASTLCLTVNRVIYRSVAMQWIYHFHYVLYKHFQACAFLAIILCVLLLSLILWTENFGCHTVCDYQNCIQKVSHTRTYLNVRFENSIMPHKNAKCNNVCEARVNGWKFGDITREHICDGITMIKKKINMHATMA